MRKTDEDFNSAAERTYQTTRREIRYLRGQRINDNKSPDATLDLTIDGEVKQEVDQNVKNEQEKRIRDRIEYLETIMNTRIKTGHQSR